MRPDVSEALRYLGIPHPTGELRREAERMADELSDAIQPRYFYRVESVEHLPDRVRLQRTELDLAGSTALGMLAGCDRAAAFPALFLVFAPLGFSLGDGMIFPLYKITLPV